MFVVKKFSDSFPGFFRTGMIWSFCLFCDECAAEQSLKIDHGIVLIFPEIFFQFTVCGKKRRYLSQFFPLEQNGIFHARHIFQERRKGRMDEPIGFCAAFTAECRHSGKGMKYIPEAAWFYDKKTPAHKIVFP